MPRARLHFRTDDVVRISIAQLRVRFTPSKWKAIRIVHVEAQGQEADVEILEEPCAETYGPKKTRRWLRCPACRRRCHTVGCVPSIGWACPRKDCGGWTGRRMRSLARSTSPVLAAAAG
jgi:hypothetical protein